MEVLIPTTMTVTIGAIFAFVTMLSSIIGVFFRLRAQLDRLQEQFDKMAQRNTHADHETESVKFKQAGLETTVAVMAQQITGMDRSVVEMKAEQKETNTLLRELIKGRAI